MTRRSLPALISIALLAPLFLMGGATGQNFPVPKGNDDNFAITRSDGTAGHIKPPDQKEVKKLVGYIRDGMNHADSLERQKQYKGKVRYLIRMRK
jgi:hypothetical protein